MKEDFKKYTLLELFQVLPTVKEAMDETYKWTEDDHTTQSKIYNKWFHMWSRIMHEIETRT